MTKKKAYWLGAAILAILLISIYSIKIIFWPEYKFTGRVVDIETKKPIEGAIAYILDSERYAITDKNGKFELGSDKPGKFLINIKARGFESKLSENKNNKILTTTDLGTVYLKNNIRVRWPIPDDIKNRDPYVRSWSFFSPEHEITRTTRLLNKRVDPSIDMDFIPRSHSLKDSMGGEWYLFFYYGNAYMITYINPDGSFERYLPTSLMKNAFRSMELKNNRLYLRGVSETKPKYQEDYLDSFSVDDFRTDSDNDSLLDRFEIFCGLDPKRSDTDYDGLADLDDPLPTIPLRPLYSDTTALLEAVLNDVTIIPLYITNHSIKEIIGRLNGKDRKWLIETIQKYEMFAESFTSQYGSFESLLSKLNFPELQRIGLMLRNNFDDFERKHMFLYYDQLAQIGENNIDRIKAIILEGRYSQLIIPVYMRGDIIDFAVHSKSSWEMILPLNSLEFRRSVLERYYIRENIELVIMNDSEAIIHYKVEGSGYEFVYVKRNGNWEKVYEVLLYIS
jgi:hypothetical protein